MLFKKNTNKDFQKVADSTTKESINTGTNVRIPICLILDTSGSMAGQDIDELNKGVQLFFDFLKNDTTAKNQVEIALITFGPGVDIASPFKRVNNLIAPTLYAYGSTPMAEAVDSALHLMDKKIKEYKTQNTTYHQPWIILMTDGVPNDDVSNVANITTRLINDNKLMFLSIGIGRCADMNTLGQFSSKTPPVVMDGLNFHKLFDWVGKSIGTISRSDIRESTELPSINWDRRE